MLSVYVHLELVMKVSDSGFVEAWVSSKSVPEVSGKTGLARPSVVARASRLRKAGVNLPRFCRAGRAVDVAGLNAIILSSAGASQ